MYPHRIRLRGPWECIPGGGAERIVKMPGSLAEQGMSGFRGAVLLRRRFGYPGRIDPWERVWLTFDDIAGAADIYLNDQLLTTRHAGRGAFEVTTLLGPRNVLETRLTAENDRGGLVGEVALEVRASAYLANVAARRASTGIAVRGEVLGEAAEALELYAMLDRRHVHYQKIAAGSAFAFETPSIGERLRLELVWRAQIWYVVEVAVGADSPAAN